MGFLLICLNLSFSGRSNGGKPAMRLNLACLA